jgi:hypothetical protein
MSEGTMRCMQSLVWNHCEILAKTVKLLHISMGNEQIKVRSAFECAVSINNLDFQILWILWIFRIYLRKDNRALISVFPRCDILIKARFECTARNLAWWSDISASDSQNIHLDHSLLRLWFQKNWSKSRESDSCQVWRVLDSCSESDMVRARWMDRKVAKWLNDSQEKWSYLEYSIVKQAENCFSDNPIQEEHKFNDHWKERLSQEPRFEPKGRTNRDSESTKLIFRFSKFFDWFPPDFADKQYRM